MRVVVVENALIHVTGNLHYIFIGHTQGFQVGDEGVPEFMRVYFALQHFFTDLMQVISVCFFF